MRPSPVASLLALFIGTIGLLAYNALLGAVAFMGTLPHSFLYLLTVLFEGVVFALPAALYYWRRPEHLPSLRIRQRLDPLAGCLIALAAVVGVFLFDGLTTSWTVVLSGLGLVPGNAGSAVPQTGAQLIYMLLALAIAPALFEETLFRGFLLPSMERIGHRWAVVFSGIAFALLHGRIEALPSHSLLGIMLAVLVTQMDCLRASMLYHAVHNAAIMIVSFILAIVPMPAWQGKAFSTYGMGGQLALMVSLTFVWVFLLHIAIRRGEARIVEPLPPAERKPLPMLATLILSACGVLLFMVGMTAFLSMLPA